jgi:hypothetical protein
MLRKLFSRLLGRRASPAAAAHDADIRIINIADGSVIKGRDAVQAHFEQERVLTRRHGNNLYFEVFRADPSADSLDGLMGERLAEIKLPGRFVNGTHSVAAVCGKLRPLLMREPAIRLLPAEQLTLYFNGRRMDADRLFYAEHFIVLPAWVQVYLHTGDFQRVIERADRLRGEV